ncbi:hypothetical protein BD780_002610 [Clostridium tetanomorphum]|uniref:Uncharacterized protein n=1 Tax=Clostridium tetanomorphum TaxID=1553 RepID=A0A923EEP6_CLOTT|nr:hypothetical protein [Clostridium tetanomorphum]MBC2399678.1 hypothetical protein [Clostridium tetanomorphum]MBP1862777.1 hypothetical protein [Clostridium tetanomorphum]NRS85385.1 hypothetical protein [Clostridium tetanomorphum]NRZ98561.1 hypothetical protein [Clostridium tetanomorphum]SQC02899.1 Uncharacterised protein [Clostridium tetanomorphum]
MEANVNKEMQDEMVGVLTAISIVSKRLATRLIEQSEKENKKGEVRHEQN